MIRIGLTGSIATGKSTVAQMFASQGVPRFDADAAVHVLLRKGPTHAAVMKMFPEAVQDGVVDRRALGRIVFRDDAALARLEGLLHPAVRAMERAFELRMRRSDRPWFIAEIPLLFETGAEARFDLTLVTTCPPWMERQRAFARGNMTQEKYAHILSRQMPSREKVRQADLEIATGLGRAHTMRQVQEVLQMIR